MRKEYTYVYNTEGKKGDRMERGMKERGQEGTQGVGGVPCNSCHSNIEHYLDVMTTPLTLKITVQGT